ncbi:MAG: hypothetical protein OEY00_07890, partial [Gammaproteobacteria bacterium]|nr:hypothetical protein [Gammaproteobacteria bacterium]
MKKVLFSLFALMLSFSTANATVISYALDYEFSGASAPAGSGPWLYATFDDGGSAGTVSLTLEAHLFADEFDGSVYFNFDPSQNSATTLNMDSWTS